MEKWERIGDDEIACFGDQTWRFEIPNGTYSITALQSEQNQISVSFGYNTEDWPIQQKEQAGAHFKLCGLADWTPEILESVCWFELFTGPNPRISYWGDRILLRTDMAVI